MLKVCVCMGVLTRLGCHHGDNELVSSSQINSELTGGRARNRGRCVLQKCGPAVLHWLLSQRGPNLPAPDGIRSHDGCACQQSALAGGGGFACPGKPPSRMSWLHPEAHRGCWSAMQRRQENPPGISTTMCSTCLWPSLTSCCCHVLAVAAVSASFSASEAEHVSGTVLCGTTLCGVLSSVPGARAR